jgi:putative chitinase
MRSHEFIFEDDYNVFGLRPISPGEAEEAAEIIRYWDPTPDEPDGSYKHYSDYLLKKYEDTNIEDLLYKAEQLNNRNMDGTGTEWLIGYLESVADGEISASDDIEEDWKKWAAGGALAAGLALGGHHAYKGTQDEPTAAPVSQQAQQSAPAKAAKTPMDTVSIPKSITDSKAEHLLKQFALKAGLKGDELAQFMAQCGHETLNFTRLKETGGSLDFKKYDPKHAPKKAKALGNTHVGDGARYAGKGFIMLTGRENYRKAGEALGIPLEQHPELLLKPEIAARVAIWYWKNRVQAKINDFRDTEAVTKYINPGMHGIDDRIEKFNAYKETMPATMSANYSNKQESLNRVPPVYGSAKTNNRYPDYPTPKFQTSKKSKKKDEKPVEKGVTVSISDAGREKSKNENFADGKHPGRKGLAKRSGVNTKASVSSLRNTAKHSTGEKARMAHWLANMKAGRAKKHK